MLLMLTAGCTLNLPVGGGARHQSRVTICDVSADPIFRIFFFFEWITDNQSNNKSRPSTYSPSLPTRCWKPTCCSSGCRSSTRSLASMCTTSCLPPGPNGWTVSSARRKPPATTENEGGTGAKTGTWGEDGEEGAGVSGGGGGVRHWF